LHKILFL